MARLESVRLKTPMVANPDRGKAVAEVAGLIEAGPDTALHHPVDVSPTSADRD